MRIVRVELVVAAALALPAVATGAECGLCARSVVVNSQLASCFLQKYPQLSTRQSGAVAVDLEDCATDRGVVAPLRGPRPAASEEPSVKFILTLSQLACLKNKLETVDGALDPSLTIDLGDCQ